MAVANFPLQRERMCFLKEGLSKCEALVALTDTLVASGAASERSALLAALFDREDIMSTGIGSGVAIPHVRHAAVHDTSVVVGISRQGIAYDALDKQPVNVIMLFAAHPDRPNEYLEQLADMMKLAKRQDFARRVAAATTIDDVFDILR